MSSGSSPALIVVAPSVCSAMALKTSQLANVATCARVSFSSRRSRSSTVSCGLRTGSFDLISSNACPSRISA